eukprot:Rmarinus@m.4898
MTVTPRGGPLGSSVFLGGCALLSTIACTLAVGDPLIEMTEVECYDGSVDLEMKEARVTVDEQVTFSTRLYHYDGVPQFPAPTIRMKAGTQCTVNIINNMPTDSSVADCHYHLNDVHCPDTTNLHTHGLHVSPYEDATDTYVLPGESLTYEFNIPENHLMGTHWYHPHYHGSTTIQVLGGMAGVLLIDPADSYSLPDDLDSLYATESIMMLNHVYISDGTPEVDDADNGGGFDLDDLTEIAARYGDDQTVDPNPEVSGSDDFYSVNGQYQPVVSVTAGEAKMLRLMHASGTRMIELELVDPNNYCEMQLIARDGVFHQTPYMDISVIAMVQATRADVALLCSEDAAGETIHFAAAPQGDLDTILGTENRHEQDIVFSVEITSSSGGGAGSGMGPTEFPTSEATFPDYLDDLREFELQDGRQYQVNLAGREFNNEVFAGFESPSMYLILGEVYEVVMNAAGGGGGGGGPPPPPPRRHLSEQRAGYYPTHDNPLENSVIERRGVSRQILQGGPPPPPGGGGGGGGGVHVYHQHINHLQIQSTADTTGLVLREGEWRDTIPVGDVTFRYPTDRFAGLMVMHCHIIEHEDEGMMTVMEVVDLNAEETEETSGAVSESASPAGTGAGNTGGATETGPGNTGPGESASEPVNECASGCAWSAIGDGVCQDSCFVEDCYYDSADCFCMCDGVLADGTCDEACNTEGCSFDGGDCTVGTAETTCDTEACTNAAATVQPALMTSFMMAISVAVGIAVLA